MRSLHHDIADFHKSFIQHKWVPEYPGDQTLNMISALDFVISTFCEYHFIPQIQ